MNTPMDPFVGEDHLVILYRPVGQKELDLIRASGFRRSRPGCRTSRSSTRS